MDPKVRKVLDAACAWTDIPSMKNAGAIKSAVRVYRETEKAKKAEADAKIDRLVAEGEEALKKPLTGAPKKKRGSTPPGVHTSAFDTSDSEDKG